MLIYRTNQNPTLLRALGWTRGGGWVIVDGERMTYSVARGTEYETAEVPESKREEVRLSCEIGELLTEKDAGLYSRKAGSDSSDFCEAIKW